MAITVRCFSQVRERLGSDRLVVDPASAPTVAALVHHLATAHPGGAALSEWLDAGHLRAAVNRVHSAPSAVLRDGDEVALFPPVSGG